MDTSRRGHWMKKYCSTVCREKQTNRIRCEKALAVKGSITFFSGINKCEWCNEPFVVDFEHRGQRFCPLPRACKRDFRRPEKIILTDEQRALNEAERSRKSADSRRGQVVSQERRDKTSATLRRRYAAGEIVPPVIDWTPERRAKASKSMVEAYREGRADLTGYYKNKWHMYRGPHGEINMRSQSEVLFALYLDQEGIDWEFEPKRFDLGWATYTPDFYLPGFGRWIEVKGAWNEVSRRKFDEFSRDHLSSAVLARDILLTAKWGQPVSPEFLGGGPHGR